MYKPEAKSPNTPKAVHFFQHFPSNFLKPYGLADPQPPESTILRRIAPMNCEWLGRPQVAASEFAETIKGNLDILSESNSQFSPKVHFRQSPGNVGSISRLIAKIEYTQR